MAVFPTIYRDAGSLIAQNPTVGALEDTLAFDPAIRSMFDGGYAATRARFTRMPRKWSVRFEGALQASKDLIKDFEDARAGGSGSFLWTNPEDSTLYTVRFLEAVIYTPWARANYTRWNITFTLEEV